MYFTFTPGRRIRLSKIKHRIAAGKDFLLSRIVNGFCQEFHGLQHGPSQAWTTACVGSALAEFRAVALGMLEALLSLQWDCGGWSYNQSSIPDADSTLRVLQFLGKVGFRDRAIINKAERFVIAHQLTDGGIATYLPEAVALMKYPAGGWTTSHPCVTALAARVLQDEQAQKKASQFISARLKNGDARAYWWRTPWYVRYESGRMNGESIGNDPVEIGLVLLLKARLGLSDYRLTANLIRLQLDDGSFPASHQFRIPRPQQTLDNITGEEEIVEDKARTFSTAAAIVAISRQEALLN